MIKGNVCVCICRAYMPCVHAVCACCACVHVMPLPVVDWGTNECGCQRGVWVCGNRPSPPMTLVLRFKVLVFPSFGAAATTAAVVAAAVVSLTAFAAAGSGAAPRSWVWVWCLACATAALQSTSRMRFWRGKGRRGE